MQLEETRELRTVVGPIEIRALGEQLAREVQDLDDAVTRHAVAKKAMKEDEESRQASIKRLSRIVATGIDHRPVRCVRAYDFKRGTATITRTDTGEVVQIREITERERQDSLPLAKDGKKDGATPADAASTDEPPVPKIEDLPSAEAAAGLAEVAVGKHVVRPLQEEGKPLRWTITNPGDLEPAGEPFASYRAACREARKRELARRADRKE